MHAESSIEEGGTPSYPEKVDFRIITSDKSTRADRESSHTCGTGISGYIVLLPSSIPLVGPDCIEEHRPERRPVG